MSQVASGVPFRRAYRDVAAQVRRGTAVAEPTTADLLAARTSTGGLGNLPLAALKGRARTAAQWNAREQRRFELALTRLVTGRTR
jgi:hypothetical protein